VLAVLLAVKILAQVAALAVHLRQVTLVEMVGHLPTAVEVVVGMRILALVQQVALAEQTLTDMAAVVARLVHTVQTTQGLVVLVA
jgi:hypothetical protein